jgi:Tol biopolymer transport system component
MSRLAILVLVLVGLAVGSVTAQVPPDAVLQDASDGGVIYKPLIGVTEKQPSDQIYIFEAASQLAKIVSSTDKGVAGNAYSDSASVSNTGEKVVFHSWATNLVVGTPRCANVFLKDTNTGAISMIKPNALSPAISRDGKFITYEYNADPQNGLPAIYRYEIATGKEEFIDYTSLGNWKGGWYMPNPQISSDGTVITYHTTKSGHPEVWEWRDGKVSKVRDGVVVDTPIVLKQQEAAIK